MCEQSEYLGLELNSNAPFCFDRMRCFDFFGPEGQFIIAEVYNTIQFLYLNIHFEIINATICFFDHLVLVFLMPIFDVRRYNGLYLSCHYAVQ